MRYFNLKALNNVRVSNLDINVNARRVFDPMHSDLANLGSLTEGNTNFPIHNYGAGNGGTFLTNYVDMGSVADTVLASGGNYDYGTIA